MGHTLPTLPATLHTLDVWKLFKQALFVGMERDCLHYLMANAHGRRDGALKAHQHMELCKFLVAAVRGCDPDLVRRYHEDDYDAVHDGTQALTSYLDDVIGFPLDSRPDYDDLVPKFFDRFFNLAMQSLRIEPSQRTLNARVLDELMHVESVYRLNVVQDGEPSTVLASMQETIREAKASEDGKNPVDVDPVVNQLRDALQLAQTHIGWCWDRIEDNTSYKRENSAVVHRQITDALNNTKPKDEPK